MGWVVRSPIEINVASKFVLRNAPYGDGDRRKCEVTWPGMMRRLGYVKEEEMEDLPRTQQAFRCFQLCQNLTSMYLSVDMVRLDERTGNAIIIIV